jgi:PAS domain S-box-containing protein
MERAHLKPQHLDLHRVHFWSLFGQSRIPMALVDRNRRYVEVNEAILDLYGLSRAEVLGTLSGRTVVDDPASTDAEWERLLSTNELYGERVIKHNGSQMRVAYAAHATTVSDGWLALIVTLSARVEPDGEELIGAPPTELTGGSGAKLTDREREVVRMVALGSTTRGIARDLVLSPDTVRSHVRNAMAKTGAHTRAQLVALVLADGHIED